MNGAQIKDLRTKLGLTQEELAGRLGVSPTTIMNWETGRHVPSRLALQKIKLICDPPPKLDEGIHLSEQLYGKQHPK